MKTACNAIWPFLVWIENGPCWFFYIINIPDNRRWTRYKYFGCKRISVNSLNVFLCLTWLWFLFSWVKRKTYKSVYLKPWFWFILFMIKCAFLIVNKMIFQVKTNINRRKKDNSKLACQPSRYKNLGNMRHWAWRDVNIYSHHNPEEPSNLSHQ